MAMLNSGFVILHTLELINIYVQNRFSPRRKSRKFTCPGHKSPCFLWMAHCIIPQLGTLLVVFKLSTLPFQKSNLITLWCLMHMAKKLEKEDAPCSDAICRSSVVLFNQLFESSIQCVLTTFTTSIPTFPDLLLIRIHPISSPFFLNKTNLCSPNILRCVVFQWTIVDLPGSSLLKKIVFLFPSS